MAARRNNKVISVIGLGVVGLTTAVGFALKGHRVIGIDIDPQKVISINEGRCPVYEEKLSLAMQKVKVEATLDFNRVLESDISFLCGGTPGKADGSLDLHYVETPVRQLAQVLKDKPSYHLIVVRSTVVPGTTEKSISPHFPNTERVGLCVNPEFLREGTALEDFLSPSRIVIGERDTLSGDTLCQIYRHFDSPTVRTDLTTAEMIKYASNAYLATRISFINEIGNICKLLGINVFEVARAMGYDERIGNKYLRAGVGFGGFCLPKDLAALIERSKEVGHQPGLLIEVLHVNEEQPKRMITLLKKHIPELKGRTIGVLGLSFKPDTDDVRKSKAIDVITMLLEEGAQVKAYDPQAMKNFARLFPHIQYASADEVLDSDAVFILTGWDSFNNLDYKGKIVIDGRGVPKAEEARIYEGISWSSQNHAGTDATCPERANKALPDSAKARLITTEQHV